MRLTVRLTLLVGLWSIFAPQSALASAVSGGTTIVNDASATYKDAANNNYSISSNQSVVTVAKVAAITVSPKETAVNPATESVGTGQSTTRTFLITNGSNIADAYTITAVAAGALTITSLSFIMPGGPVPVTVGKTISPVIAPGSSIAVQVLLSTKGLSVGQVVPVTLSAQTTTSDVANGLQTDSGQEFIVGSTAPSISGLAGSKIDKTVNKIRAAAGKPGGVVSYDITARNSGGSPATNVVVVDPLPAGIVPIISTVKINGTPAGSAASAVGQNLNVLVGTLAPGEALDLSFDATVANIAVLGQTFVNTAGISADGLPEQTTLPASVFIGSSNIVYDGYAGQSQPVGGSTVTMLDSSGKLVTFSSDATSALMRTISSSGQVGTNPYVTGPDGLYAFPLSPTQVDPGGSRFYFILHTPGFLNRKIALDIMPENDGFLYDVKAISADNEPLAEAGSFTLTGKNVTLSKVFGLFGNIPLFRSSSINVTKSSRVQVAVAGDRVDYSIAFSNAVAQPALQASIIDSMPAGLVYAPATAFLDGTTPFAPTIAANVLTWNLDHLDPGVVHTITYSAIIFPSVSAGSRLLNGVTVGGIVNGQHVSGSSSVTVTVIGGAFGNRRVLTGRVFLDTMHSGHFTAGDRGVAGVRIFLEDGTYVVTDPDGRFTFPGVRPGMHVLRIDETTLPANAKAFSGEPVNSNRSTKRLIHGILDESTMEDIEFALASQ